MLTTPEKLIKLLMARKLYAKPTKNQRTAFATLKAFIIQGDWMKAYDERLKLTMTQLTKPTDKQGAKRYSALSRILNKKIEYKPDPAEDSLSDPDIQKYQVKSKPKSNARVKTQSNTGATFTKAECEAWKKDKTHNPKTGRKISATAKNGVYQQLQKACA